MARLLLRRAGYAHVAYGSPESAIERTKESHSPALRQTQGTIRTDQPDSQPWDIWFLKTLERHKDRLERKIERERLIPGNMPLPDALNVLAPVTARGVPSRIPDAPSPPFCDDPGPAPSTLHLCPVAETVREEGVDLV